MFNRFYQSIVKLSESRYAPQALAAVSFAESAFFPIPPDALLIPMSIAKPQRAYLYALICTVASVLGGILGYSIGALLYDTVGKWLIGLYGYGDKIDQLRVFYATWGAAFIILKGLTPIPFKLVTIVSGILGYNFGLFVVLAFLTRGARFFIEAVILTRYGDRINGLMERHFAAFLGVLAVMIGAGFVIAAKFV